MRPMPPLEVVNSPMWFACVRGFGQRRRVVLSDRLLNEASADVVQGVMAHEHGHHIYWHVEQKLAFLLIALASILYGVLTWNAWLTCALVIVFPMLWNVMVIMQEMAADRHALTVTGRPTLMQTLRQCALHATSPSAKGALLVRIHRLTEGE